MGVPPAEDIGINPLNLPIRGKPMNEQPTPEQIKEFWEWCGFEWVKFPQVKAEGYWLWDKSGEHLIEWLLTVDLNNLFKYAVPKVYDMKLVKANRFEQEWKVAYSARVRMPGRYWTETPKYEDPALALFWALWQVKEKSNE